MIYDQDGVEFSLASGRDDESERIRLSLHDSEVFPTSDDRGAPVVYTHVEAKYAQRMREAGQTHGVVVLNRTICNMGFGCGAAVRAILPHGSTLTVWEPGATRPVEIRGEAKP